MKPYAEEIEFHKIKGYSIEVGQSGESQGRITIFRSTSKPWTMMERVPGSQIVVIGEKAKSELRRMVTKESRNTIRDKNLINGGIAGRAYNALRKYLLAEE